MWIIVKQGKIDSTHKSLHTRKREGTRLGDREGEGGRTTEVWTVPENGDYGVTHEWFFFYERLLTSCQQFKAGRL